MVMDYLIGSVLLSYFICFASDKDFPYMWLTVVCSPFEGLYLQRQWWQNDKQIFNDNHNFQQAFSKDSRYGQDVLCPCLALRLPLLF